MVQIREHSVLSCFKYVLLKWRQVIWENSEIPPSRVLRSEGKGPTGITVSATSQCKRSNCLAYSSCWSFADGNDSYCHCGNNGLPRNATKRLKDKAKHIWPKMKIPIYFCIQESVVMQGFSSRKHFRSRWYHSFLARV